MNNEINMISNRMFADIFPMESVLQNENRESGIVHQTRTEGKKSDIRLENLIMSMDDMKRLFLIMLPGKIYIPEEKGKILDIRS